jgi:hypothetical protein
MLCEISTEVEEEQKKRARFREEQELSKDKYLFELRERVAYKLKEIVENTEVPETLICKIRETIRNYDRCLEVWSDKNV